MSEFPSTDEVQAYRDLIRRLENKKCDQAREETLEDHLLHPGIIDTFDPNQNELEVRWEIMQLRNEFLEEKKGKNFGERFAMAISNKYLGKVSVIELGVTEHIGSAESQDLKEQYRDIRNWLVTHSVIEDELNREQSGRFFRLSLAPVRSINRKVPAHVVVSRVRPLLEGEIINEAGQTALFKQLKLSVFSMSGGVYIGLREKYGAELTCSERFMEHVEKMMDENDENFINPIRTAYYQITHLAGDAPGATIEV